MLSPASSELAQLVVTAIDAHGKRTDSASYLIGAAEWGLLSRTREPAEVHTSRPIPRLMTHRRDRPYTRRADHKVVIQSGLLVELLVGSKIDVIHRWTANEFQTQIATRDNLWQMDHPMFLLRGASKATARANYTKYQVKSVAITRDITKMVPMAPQMAPLGRQPHKRRRDTDEMPEWVFDPLETVRLAVVPAEDETFKTYPAVANELDFALEQLGYTIGTTTSEAHPPKRCLPCPQVKPGLLVQLRAKAAATSPYWTPEKVEHQWTAEEFNEAITTRKTQSGDNMWEIKLENIHIFDMLPKGEPLMWPSQIVGILRRKH
jgi:hypothetical protein